MFSSPSATAASVSVEETTVSRAVRSFPAGSSCSPDDFRQQQLLHLINYREGGAELLSGLNMNVNMLLKR